MNYTGILTYYNAEKGYGFVEITDQGKVMVFKKDLPFKIETGMLLEIEMDGRKVLKVKNKTR